MGAAHCEQDWPPCSPTAAAQKMRPCYPGVVWDTSYFGDYLSSTCIAVQQRAINPRCADDNDCPNWYSQ